MHLATEEILDVLVDVRRDSPRFGRRESSVLIHSSRKPVFCPDGFAHGLYVEEADVIYGCSSYYDPALEGGFAFDDPDVAIASRRD